MIHAQHGTKRTPHVFFDVLEDERYSETLDIHKSHRLLRIGYNYSGPTEIGGLVLQPEYRGHKVALGKWLSYVRFLYIGLHRPDFRDEVISELLPPLDPDGTSIMWEAIGRQFTGMSYQEADRLSQTNKEFVRALFPQEPHLSVAQLFPKDARQDVIGQVGPQTKGVEAMLRRIGFRYAERIDPFDGGPHFIARTDEITLVRGAHRLRASSARRGRRRRRRGGRSGSSARRAQERAALLRHRKRASAVDGDADLLARGGLRRSSSACRPATPVGVVPAV